MLGKQAETVKPFTKSVDRFPVRLTGRRRNRYDCRTYYQLRGDGWEVSCSRGCFTLTGLTRQEADRVRHPVDSAALAEDS